MILNVSGRTDIPAFYSEWFYNRYKEGFLDVRNPFYPKKVSRIYFEDVDLILFCSKNPTPIIKYLKYIDKKIVFHITLTPYKKDIEPNIPGKGNVINAIKKISKILGKDYVYVRYDPIFLSDRYNIDYHIKAFDNMCRLLKGYVNHIIVSFIDEYKSVKDNKNILKIKPFSEDDFRKIGINFSKSAKENLMTVSTCSEKNNLKEYGFVKDDCMSFNLAFKLTGKTNFKKWTSRKNKYCNCVSMVDIGAYNSCLHYCKYCYANFDSNKVSENYSNHIKTSTLLIGELDSSDIVERRKN